MEFLLQLTLMNLEPRRWFFKAQNAKESLNKQLNDKLPGPEIRRVINHIHTKKKKRQSNIYNTEKTPKSLTFISFKRIVRFILTHNHRMTRLEFRMFYN